MRNLKAPIIVGGVILSVLSASAQAEITVLDKNKQSDSLLAPLSLQVGGSIRPEWIFQNTKNKTHGDSSGHDGGTRFRFSGDYALTDHTSIIGKYELGVNMYHLLNIKSGYDESSNLLKKRQLYYGFKDDRYGTLTYGKQYGPYYDIVGSKSDVWDNDGQAAGEGVGLSGDFDGGNRPYNSIKYVNTIGAFTIDANYLLPETEYDAGSDSVGDDLHYRRDGGGGLGIDYAVTKTLTWSGVYTLTNARMKNDNNDSKQYHQQTTATALTWQPGAWYLVATANYYKDYVPSHQDNVNQNNYFAGDGYGLEAFAGYTFTFNKELLKSVQPYVAADQLKLKGNEDYDAHHVYLGTAFDFGHHLSLYVERTLARAPGQSDSTAVSFYYNF
ncbi:porin [Rouxiella badensis]|jgi:predicted porin|uniref:porin n=1 Tax=Rouxiella badensis TaxID=1646377 RepID=UPI0003675995|nr:porin [Rouxiella badensis]MCC3718725.1 porin [Rouxiella badensis]MCC3727936.1 porin [Rouxiella badensis]MCC3732896.1 porin [Rouxiella badensis]MCC3739680.1 porin [Rouxiella badensis]MCC3757658.1 porin [Rouxiella badensis]